MQSRQETALQKGQEDVLEQLPTLKCSYTQQQPTLQWALFKQKNIYKHLQVSEKKQILPSILFLTFIHYKSASVN